jgi:serine/threonine-protein kinase
MLTSAGVKLIDFGTSGVVGEIEPDDVLRATPAYVAPELLAGNGAGPPGDVFGLGAVLYRAVAGYPPWTGDTVHDVLTALTTTDPPPLPSTVDVPDEVARACLSCLSRDPAERPTAEQMASILTDALAVGKPGRHRSPRPYGVLIRTAVAAGLVAMAAGLGYVMTGSDPPPSSVGSILVLTPDHGSAVPPTAGRVAATVPTPVTDVHNGHETSQRDQDDQGP